MSRRDDLRRDMYGYFAGADEGKGFGIRIANGEPNESNEER
jgi:hypothetical protein